ncbi:MAG: FlgD immunoglobulin-like domain containing protein, partial [candidate division WOR-3 bacterium]
NPTAPSRIIYKINTSGTVLRQFANPANDYPTGLAWMPTSRWLYAADRRTSAGATPIIYRCDTLGGNVSSVNLTIGDNYGPRGLAIEPYGPDTTLLLVYTHFSSDATPVLLKIVLYELRRSDGAVLNSVTLPGWNVRGVEYDPRDGNYWLTIAQNPNRAIVKILGFRGIPGVGIDEELQPGPLEKISLSPGMPTPFKNTVKFNYSVPVKMRVRLAVYDITGRHVKTFVNGEVEPGTQTIIWNGMDENNKRCASGVYLCYMETEHGSVVRKFVMSK